MSVIKVQEGFDGQEGSDSTKTKERTRVFLVEVDDPTDEMDIVLAGNLSPGSGDDPLPKVGDPYPGALSSYSNSVVTRLSAKRTKSRLFWIITAQYSSEGEGGGGIIHDDPLEDDWDVKWSHESKRFVQEDSVTDVTDLDNPGVVTGTLPQFICNMAGYPFHPGYEGEKRILIGTLVINKATYDLDQACEFIDSINASEVTVCGKAFPKRTLKLTIYSGEEAHDRGGYWRVSYQIYYDPDTWVLFMENRGMMDYDGKWITNTKGETTKDDVYLEDDGSYNPANPPDPNKIAFGVLKEKDFSQLNLPVAAPTP